MKARESTVFISYNSSDAECVTRIVGGLKTSGIKFWMDTEMLQPGDEWQHELCENIARSSLFVIFIGKEIGKWQRAEAAYAIEKCVESEGEPQAFEIIVVRLPDGMERGTKEIPPFLKRYHWLDLQSIDENKAMQILQKSICSKIGGTDVTDGLSMSKTEKLLDCYIKVWRNLLSIESDTVASHLEMNKVKAFQRRFDHLRLDRYVWPSLDYILTVPRDKEKETKLNSADMRNMAIRLLRMMLGGDSVILDADPGMGKTALTCKLIELIVSDSSSGIVAHGRQPLFVLIDEGWPRNEQGDLKTVEGAIIGEVARRLSCHRQTFSKIAMLETVRDAIDSGSALIIVDGFDQMDLQERSYVAKLIGGKIGDNKDRFDANLCKWMILGRTYAIREWEDSLKALCRVRWNLDGMNEWQQDRYFSDFNGNPFFESRKVLPLDWVCLRRSEMDHALRIPMTLRMIRELIECDLMNGREVRRIESVSELHVLIASESLKRSISLADNYKMPDLAIGPIDKEKRLSTLLHVCSTIAFQMMLEDNREAVVVDSNSRPNAVSEFLERSRLRFIAGKSTVKDSTNQNAEQPDHNWNWAIWMLETTEFALRGHIDAFSKKCRSFRDRKTMEWYAAYYLMNHATEADLYNVPSGLGERCGRDFAFHPEWLENCWLLAIAMPNNAVNDEAAVRSLGVLFERPTNEECAVVRPCRHMFMVWDRWIEPSNIEPSNIEPSNNASRKLRGADRLVARFRSEILQIEQGDSIDTRKSVLTLLHDNVRDAPNLSLTHSRCPNQTQDGWYRRIPDVGETAAFKGERPVEVTVSKFWLRKFVVTNGEYRLFNPNHPRMKHVEDDSFLPVTNVSWFDATMFSRWLGSGYCLPTEAQWEAACRANLSSDGSHLIESKYWFGDDASVACQHIWCDSYESPPTKSLNDSQQALGHENRWGLFDMAGNVWEWCQDWMGRYDERERVDPRGPTSGKMRVYRSGRWFNTAGHGQSSARGSQYPEGFDHNLGFRVACVPHCPTEKSVRLTKPDNV